MNSIFALIFTRLYHLKLHSILGPLSGQCAAGKDDLDSTIFIADSTKTKLNGILTLLKYTRALRDVWGWYIRASDFGLQIHRLKKSGIKLKKEEEEIECQHSRK